jgi:two-component system OmpR family sensor kinase
VLGRLSLRARLVVGVIALAAAGLAAADVATYTSLRSFLVDRLDRSVAASARSLGDSIAHHGRPDPGELDQLAASVPGVYVGIRTPLGKTTWDAAGTRPDETPLPEPKLTGAIASDHTAELGAASGSTRYRTRAEPLPQGYTLLVAAPLGDVNGTLHRLLLVELLVTAAVLAAVTALGLWVIRLGLRPLDAIEETARAIAVGDLTRRVERAEERTEVGRLGLALNAMLGQIESAFRAQEASERKLRRFVADASHELRTPLAAVRAYAELFSRGAAERPDDLARSMSGITRESERMSVLVDDLLLLARLDEGRPLEREPVELESVIAEAVETARTVEPDRPIAVALHPAVVTGDRDRLRQIVDNLLANVRAHTPAGTPVRVTLETTDGHATISVADDGPGMTAEEATHVFERFYRADPSRARTSGGAGLGLAIVAAVAEAHGGAACAASEPGEGATLWIELPLAPT